jgi:hypothetical protein
VKRLALLIVLILVSGAAAAPPEEAITPLERYTTEKGKILGTTFAAKLRHIYDRVYQCRPWLDVHKSGLGFTRPAGAAGDDRYLNIWVWVDQKVTPEFAALSQARRASAMFSRHGVDLLRQLAADGEIFASPGLTGYSVILTWLKPNARSEEGQKAETLGVFADKATARLFLAKRIGAQEFVKRATIVAFDGQDRMGRLPLEIWEDNFATTYKLKGYEPEDARAC